MKFYKHGKDREMTPCVELDDGTIVTSGEILLALIKALVKKGAITKAELKAELE